MSDIAVKNKRIASLVHKALKEAGAEIKLGHVYHMLSKLAGYRNWNTAKALGVDFEKAITTELTVEEELKRFGEMLAFDASHSSPSLDRYIVPVSPKDFDFLVRIFANKEGA